MNDNFKRRNPGDNRQRYLRYDDVFMSSKGANKQRNTKPSWTSSEDAEWDSVAEDGGAYEYDEYRDDPIEYTSEEESNEPRYFSGRNNIINERMVRYQKHRLPPLQRYATNEHRDAYAEFNQSYWDDERRQARRQKLLPLGALWQKFIITFASILSLVCISWLIYNWNSNKPNQVYDANGIPVIEPNQPSFKVLPEAPGGAEISYRDKSVYSRVDTSAEPKRQEERLLPPQEETFSIPERESANENEVEEYSIVTDKLYFIKISAGKDRQELINEAKIYKKKYASLFAGKEVFVKKVSNAKGQTQRAILVGSFSSQEEAVSVAHQIGIPCSVISVHE